MKTLAYSYKRFSSLSNQRDGSSIERQLALATEICQSKGWQLIDLPPDRGLSGFTGANRVKGALGKFIQRVESGDVPVGSVCIIEKLDRFSRNEVDLVLPDFLKLLQAGVSIYSCVDSTHYTLADIRKSPMLINYAVMAMAMANDFSKTLSGRIKNTWNVKMAKATNGERVNFGGWRPRWLNADNTFNKHIITIKRIVSMYLTGESMLAIAKALNADKVECLRRGTRWSQSQISMLLKSPYLIGNAEIKGVKYPNYYKAAITDTERQQIDVKLSQNKDRKGRTGKRVTNIFKHRCFCAKCGGRITVKTNSRKPDYYLKCLNHNFGKCSCKHTIPVSRLEFDFFSTILQTDPRALLEKKTDDKTTPLLAKLATIDRQIEDTTKLIGSVGVEILSKKLNEFKAERVRVEESLAELNRHETTMKDMPKAIDDIRALMIEDDKLGINFVSTAYDEALKRLEVNLANDDNRKAILNVIGNIVERIVIDTDEPAYKVYFTNGSQSENVHLYC